MKLKAIKQSKSITCVISLVLFLFIQESVWADTSLKPSTDQNLTSQQETIKKSIVLAKGQYYVPVKGEKCSCSKSECKA